MTAEHVNIRWLGLCNYQHLWQAMQDFTNSRNENTADEIWLLEHHPVFTQGQNGKPEHILNPGVIPIIQTDRGGQVTYHGPGQLMAYTLVDLRRKKLAIRDFVSILETSVCQMLTNYKITTYTKAKAPGVYVELSDQQEAKICSIGLRVRKGCSYHGIAFNIDMDLDPFTRINPCGFEQLRMAQLTNFATGVNVQAAGKQLVNYLLPQLMYTQHTWL